MSIVKVNTGLFFALSLAISGGIFAKKLLTPHPRFHPLLSKSLKQYPGLKFHPHSEHYIYNFDTVEETDKPEFTKLSTKLKEIPSNFPSQITLETVSAPSVVSLTDLNTENSLTDNELYLISKYWLQLLPHFNSELLKCLAGPVAKPTSTGETYPSNCPSMLTWPASKTTESQTTEFQTTESQKTEPQTIEDQTTPILSSSFSMPSSLHTNHHYKFYKCLSPYCRKNPCTSCQAPYFSFPGSFPSYFSYPNPSHSTDKLKTFNATIQSESGGLQTKHLRLPLFSFPMPNSLQTNPQTQNTIASKSQDLKNLPHWPQSIVIDTEINNENIATDHKTSLDVLVSKLFASPSSFRIVDSNIKLQANSPSQLFFARYLATLYALLWSYSPDNLPLFPPSDLFSLSSKFSASPLFSPSFLPNCPTPQTQSSNLKTQSQPEA